MKTLGLISLIIGVVILQVSFVAALRPLGVVPNLVIALVVAISFRFSVSRGLAAALGGGLALDLVAGTPFGLETVILMLTALGAGALRRSGFNIDGYLASFLVVTAATVVANLVLALTVITSYGLSILVYSGGTGLRELLLNLGWTVIIVPMVGLLTGKPRVMAVPGGGRG